MIVVVTSAMQIKGSMIWRTTNNVVLLRGNTALNANSPVEMNI